MSKIDKLYNRLLDLEKEFKALLIEELEKMLKGRHSSYLGNRASLYPMGKKFKDHYISKMENIENEIIILREKIYGTIENRIICLVDDLIKFISHKYSDEQRRYVFNNALILIRSSEIDDYS